MATRLYPKTLKASNLEAIVGVPAGTHHTYLLLTSMDRPGMTDADEAAWHDLLNEVDTLARYGHFMLYGWGRIVADARAYGYDPVAGCTTNPAHVAAMLVEQGVDINVIDPALCEGLCWS